MKMNFLWITNSTSLMINNRHMAYSWSLPLKTEKYNDVMELGRKYVAQNNMCLITEGEYDD